LWRFEDSGDRRGVRGADDSMSKRSRFVTENGDKGRGAEIAGIKGE